MLCLTLLLTVVFRELIHVVICVTVFFLLLVIIHCKKYPLKKNTWTIVYEMFIHGGGNNLASQFHK